MSAFRVRLQGKEVLNRLRRFAQGRGTRNVWFALNAFPLQLTLLLFLLIPTSSCHHAPRQTGPPKFAGAYNAMNAVQVATAAVVHYARFGELLRHFATEIALADEQASTERERAVLGHYKEVLAIYKDSLVIWSCYIEGLSAADSFGALGENVWIDGELWPIIVRYQLETHEQEAYAKHKYRTISFSSVQKLWGLAAAKMRHFSGPDEYVKGGREEPSSHLQ